MEVLRPGMKREFVVEEEGEDGELILSLADIEVCGRLNPHVLLERPHTRISQQQQQRSQVLTSVAVLAMQQLPSTLSVRH